MKSVDSSMESPNALVQSTIAVIPLPELALLSMNVFSLNSTTAIQVLNVLTSRKDTLANVVKDSRTSSQASLDVNASLSLMNVNSLISTIAIKTLNVLTRKRDMIADVTRDTRILVLIILVVSVNK